MSPSRPQRASVSDVVEVVKAYAMQDVGEDVFDYKLSFIPSVIVLVVTVAIVALVASRIKRTGLSSREPPR